MPKKNKIDPRTPLEFSALPKFLIADDGEDRVFIIHCHYPRLIIEMKPGLSSAPLWIDSPIFDPALGEPSSQSARLMRQAGDFFAREMFRDEGDE